MSKSRRNLEERSGPHKPSTSPVMAKRRIPEQYETFGKVELRLDLIAKQLGIVNYDGRPNRAEVQRRTGINDETLFYMLRHPQLVDRIHFRTLAKICNGLGVHPADLLHFTPHMGGESPLSDLYKTNREAGQEG